jgi:hypothetical protein
MPVAAYDDTAIDAEYSVGDPYAPAADDPRALAKKREPWRYPKRPPKDAICAEAERVKEEHAYALAIRVVMNSWLNGEQCGYFPRDAEAIRDKEITPVYLPDLRNEHFDMVTWHSRMDVHIKAVGRAAIDDEETEAVEDFDRLLWEQMKADYRDAYGADLLSALADGGPRTGMLAAYLAVDPANDVTGLHFEMLDPFATYPIWEGKRGLAKVYVVGEATADRVIGWYGDNGGAVERKVKKIARRDAEEYDPFCTKDLILFWDRNNTVVIWGGEIIRAYEHGYGHVPIIVETSNLGMQGYMSTPTNTVTSVSDTAMLRIGDELWQASASQLDMARRCQPLFWRRLFAHSLKEALATRAVSVFRRNTSHKGRPMVVGQTPMSVKDGVPENVAGEEDVMTVRADDVVNPYPNEPAPQIMAALQALTVEATASSAAASTISGGNLGGAQASGNAVDMLNTMGNERWSPASTMIQGFLTQVFTRANEYARDYGTEMSGDDFPDGLLVPRSKPDPIMGLTDPHELTPDMLMRSGCRVTVTLRKFNPQSLAPMAQAMLMLKQSGLISEEAAIETLAVVNDPDDERRRIREDQLNAVPELMAADQLELCHMRAMRALAAGDQESARRQVLKAKYLGDQLTVAMMARMSMVSQATIEAMQMGAVAQGMTGGSNPAMLPNPAQMSGAGGGGMQSNVAPYMSPSQFGGTTGNQGGRPQMPGLGGM